MAPKIFVLVPPSEAKAPGGSRVLRPGIFDGDLGDARLVVVEHLQHFAAGATLPELERLFNARGPLLERAIGTLGDLGDGRAPIRPAWRRYTGVVWSHLDPTTLSSSERHRILVTSGLYGVTSGVDHVADYRLKMGARLAPLGSLSAFWRPSVTAALAARLGRSTVVNLLPREDASAIDFASLRRSCRVVDIEFVGEGVTGTVGHAAKAVKGIVARRILRDGLAALDGFEWAGWRRAGDPDSVTIVAPSGVPKNEGPHEGT